MKLLLPVLVSTGLGLSSPARADDAPPSGVVPTVKLPLKDLEKFVQLAKERRCLDESSPEFSLDPVTIVTDVDGRVFYSGGGEGNEQPYEIRMHWCHYDVTVKSTIKLVVARKEPETWGFRFRPKAYLGWLPLKVIDGARLTTGIDAGFMLDLFYWEDLNLNVAVGVRSIGAGVGFDLTRNFGVFVGYGVGWSSPLHNLNVSAYFAF